jgi:hypothetical protein
VGNPGPGEYEVPGIKAEGKFVTKRIRGKSVKVRKADTTSCTFKSTTGRLLDNNLMQAAKTQIGHVGQYDN